MLCARRYERESAQQLCRARTKFKRRIRGRKLQFGAISRAASSKFPNLTLRRDDDNARVSTEARRTKNSTGAGQGVARTR